MPDYVSKNARGELAFVEATIAEPVWGEVDVTGRDTVIINTIIGGDLRIEPQATAVVGPQAVIMGDVHCAGRAVIFGEVVGGLLATDDASVLIHPEARTQTVEAWRIYEFRGEEGFCHKRAPLLPAPPTFLQWLREEVFS